MKRTCVLDLEHHTSTNCTAAPCPVYSTCRRSIRAATQAKDPQQSVCEIRYDHVEEEEEDNAADADVEDDDVEGDEAQDDDIEDDEVGRMRLRMMMLRRRRILMLSMIC